MFWSSIKLWLLFYCFSVCAFGLCIESRFYWRLLSCWPRNHAKGISVCQILRRLWEQFFIISLWNLIVKIFESLRTWPFSHIKTINALFWEMFDSLSIMFVLFINKILLSFIHILMIIFHCFICFYFLFRFRL